MPSRAESAARQAWVLKELSLLRPRAEIKAELTQFEGISPQTADRYIQKAQQELLKGISATQRDELLAGMVSTLQSTARRSAASERYGETVAAVIGAADGVTGERLTLVPVRTGISEIVRLATVQTLIENAQDTICRNSAGTKPLRALSRPCLRLTYRRKPSCSSAVCSVTQTP